MKIELVPFADNVAKTELNQKTVVVIDVLRATTVMITALANGAKNILPASSVEQANTLALQYLPEDRLLCGERNARKIEGFDLGNSPLEFTTDTVTGKTIILTTTNGTRALNFCKGAKDIYIGAFINIKALVQKIQSSSEIVLVCSGTAGKFSLDDSICAAMIIDELSRTKEIFPDDLGQLILRDFRNNIKNIKELLNGCFHARYLKQNGYEKDVRYCFKTNTIGIVPIYKDGMVTSKL